MKTLYLIAAAAIMAAASPAQAQQRPYPEGKAPAPKAVSDPLVRIYDVSGVKDNSGSAELGVATSFHRTNHQGVANNVRFVVRDREGQVKADRTVTIRARETHTASTHATVLFSEDTFLDTGLVSQGSAIIFATSNLVACSAMIVDAGSGLAQGIALHLRRFNASPGSQE